MEHRLGSRQKLDADDLLLNGFWKSTRAPSASSIPSVSLKPTSYEVPKLAKSQRRPSPDWPPRPVVEDEVDALAKELSGAETTANEPPFRGTVDQHPIILESHISAADAVKLHSKLDAEIQVEDTGERRFVLIPRGDTHSPIQDDDDDDDNELRRISSTKPQTPKPTAEPTQSDARKRTSGKYDDTAPPVERRRSRQDLPSLQTKVGAETSSFRRSASAYAYTPTSKDSAKAPRTSAADLLLSPQAVPFRGQSKGYFDLSSQTALRQAPTGTPVAEKRRSGGPSISRPTTPVLEKGYSTGSDTYFRSKQDAGERLTRPQQLSTESGARRSERAPSSHSYLETADSRHRKSSSQSSRKYYSSSDDDQDSSDSGRRRRRHHHHHHRHHAQPTLRPDDDRDRHHRSGSKSARSSVELKPGSRISSPLASPNISPSQLSPVDRVENLRNASYAFSRESRRPSTRPVSPLSGYPEPPHAGNTLDPSIDAGRPRAGSRSRPRSRRSSPVAAPGTRAAGAASATLPMPIPTRIDLHSPDHSTSMPQYDEDYRSTRPSVSPKPFWQPPPFKPSSDPPHLGQPMGSYRRYSQEIEDGNIAPLPPCPRMTLSRSHSDWLTLPRCPAFNICPSCFQSTMAPTEFHGHFVAATPRPPNEGVLCDFGSQPWYRIAWLLTRKERRRDLNLMASLANIAATTTPCSGKREAVRKWYSIIDPDTGNPIRNFDVCLSCVKSIETVLPALSGIFVRTDHSGPAGLPRVCDMRFDSKRFVHYFDALETSADLAADSRSPPDMTDFAQLAKRFASIPECPRDETLTNSYWYIITQLPELTVCPECFDEVVVPDLENDKAIPLMFNKSRQRMASASCQLYSPRMRGIFETAVDGNDYKMLATKARERREMEVEIKKEISERKRLGKSGEKEMKRIEGEWAKWE